MARETPLEYYRESTSEISGIIAGLVNGPADLEIGHAVAVERLDYIGPSDRPPSELSSQQSSVSRTWVTW